MRLSIILILTLILQSPKPTAVSSYMLDEQQKPAAETPYTLNEQQKQQWNQFAQQEQQLTSSYSQAISNAVNTPVGEGSRDIHAAIQQTWLSLSLVKTRREAFLNGLRAEHGCKGCEIEDGKLTKPSTAK